MLLTFLTVSHVLISLGAIALGFAATYGMLTSQLWKRTNEWFLITTIATSITGFFFPVQHFLPSHAVGIISLLALAVSGIAFWRHRLQRAWLVRYAVSGIFALYLNVFVLLVQLFRRVPALNELAPTQTEPAFQLTQLVVLIAFVAVGIVATRRLKKVLVLDEHPAVAA